jgi:hypothetical protein
MAMIRRNDWILFYVIGKKELYGVYRALDRAFFDDSLVWPATEDGQTYPLRVRIENSEEVFAQPILLSDIYDLRDNGLVWSFALDRWSGHSNVMFSISDAEFEHILRLYLKVNHVLAQPKHISEPYRHIEPNILAQLTFKESSEPKYESTLSALFIDSLARGLHTEIFGAYTDYLAYIPTSFQKEIDALLFHSFPGSRHDIVAYTIVELKRDRFTEEGLAQLLRYEDWFLKKRVAGDSRAIRTIAVAKSFDQEVIAYLAKRNRIEAKPVKLLRYEAAQDGLKLIPALLESSDRRGAGVS